MKKFAFTFGLVACFGIIFCSTGKTEEKSSGVQDNLELIIEPGENWQNKMKVFIFSVKKNPQIAAWIEDSEGNYISTIAVSEKSAKGKWMSAPKEGRPEALPVWNHRQKNFSITSDLDAVSSATTKSSLKANINRDLLVKGKTYNVYLEINHSFDYNEHWTKDNSGVNGQPSLVYHAQFIAGETEHTALVPIGCGSVDGSDGDISEGLENFTSVLDIVKSVYIVGK